MYLVILLSIVALGIIGPSITPYKYDRVFQNEDGSIVRNAPPSADHPLGTTDKGHDVLSRVLYGARPTVLTGLVGGSIIITLGLTVGVLSGYYGGYTDEILMRITDFMYGVPLLPFAIVLVALLGMGFFSSIAVIGLILWRGTARVLRSEVLQLKESPYILSTKAAGASDTHVIFHHIIPNIAPMAVLQLSLGIGYAILTQASLAFIGVVNPFIPSWGVMIRNAYASGTMTISWWWSVAPGMMISLTVLSIFLFGRRMVEDDSTNTGVVG
jgi:peptide/nickel transport system permease protein